MILAFVSFAAGATLLVVGRRGNSRIFTLPVREQLAAIAQNLAVWRWANLLMGLAAVLLVAGMGVLAAMLATADERWWSRAALAVLTLAAVLWVAFSAFRAISTPVAAVQLAETGQLPASYEPSARWATLGFRAYVLLGSLALAGFGVSLLSTRVVPGWAAWVMIAFSLAVLAHFLFTGDTLPGFHYLPPVLLAILLYTG